MARQLRVEYPGAIYHITCRMVGDAAKGGASWPLEKRVFRDDADNERFVERLSGRVKQFNIRLYLFVLNGPYTLCVPGVNDVRKECLSTN